jgi:hypothetical protein
MALRPLDQSLGARPLFNSLTEAAARWAFLYPAVNSPVQPLFSGEGVNVFYQL